MKIYQTCNGPCPYLPAGQWTTNVFYADRISGSSYESLLENGWRRSGCSFYYNTCLKCQSCMPLRVDVQRFCPNRSQKRTLKRNHDITIERIPAAFHAQDYTLYQHYCLSRHNQSPTEDEYDHFLIQSPLTTEIMRYWVDNNLIAAAWVDLLPNSLSSVYCAYNPKYAQRAPGIVSILLQIELCRRLQKAWLYLGFFVADSPRMRYKNKFQPCQELIKRQWRNA